MLKTKKITTDKAALLVCELPEGAKNVRVEKGYIRYDNESFNGCILPVVLSEKGKGNWQLLGRLPDITENEWKGVIDDYDNGYFYYPDGYKDTCDTDSEIKHSLQKSLFYSKAYIERNAYYIEWLDSVGVYIEVGAICIDGHAQYDYNIQENNTLNGMNGHIFWTRHEATKAAVEQANKIYNEI